MRNTANKQGKEAIKFQLCGGGERLGEAKHGTRRQRSGVMGGTCCAAFLFG